ncbi:MAG: methyltransferase domain-containing protein [Anaerolineales bacterium]|nr:methyltransferase domain-containing protein [Anaerolineales bacterium]
MNILEIIDRNMAPVPWEEGEKVPWNEPGFSQRMLAEHLAQDHDAASRRTELIERHIHWIHSTVLGETPARILDLGCGPGLYTSRLAKLGHVCHGIDFSPASIAYARENAPEGCSYEQADLRAAVFGLNYDLVMFIFGEFNAFRPEDARLILDKVYAALAPGGKLLMEVSTFEGLEQQGCQPAMWYSAEQGLFSANPHLCLMESYWDEALSVSTERYWILDQVERKVDCYSASLQAYQEAAYRELAAASGFVTLQLFPTLTGEEDAPPDDMIVLLAEK